MDYVGRQPIKLDHDATRLYLPFREGGDVCVGKSKQWEHVYFIINIIIILKNCL
jgi:hypothetical protein